VIKFDLFDDFECLLFEAFSTDQKNAKWNGFQTAKSCFCWNSRFQHVKHCN